MECEWYFTVIVAMFKECYRVVDLLTGYNSQNWLPLAVEVARRFLRIGRLLVVNGAWQNLGCTKCEMNTSEYGVYGQIFVFINIMLQ